MIAEFDLRSLKIRKFYHKLNMIFINTGVKMRVPNCKKTHEKLNLIIWYLIIFWSGNTLGQVDIDANSRVGYAKYQLKNLYHFLCE